MYPYQHITPVIFVDPSGFSYDEVINALDSIYNAKNTMNHTTPGSTRYDSAYNRAMQQKEVIRNSDIYIENWSGLTNLLDEIVNGNNNSLEKIQTTKDKVIAAKNEWESTNFRDDLIFVAVVGGTALIAVKTGAAVLSGGGALKYPGNDPNKPPGKGWEWRGSGVPSEGKGSWYNPNTGESLHPDLNHPQPIGPHWGYVPYRHEPEYRWYPDGTMELK